ncbi:13975_t:CDS:1, partial [Racocetra fulgida]
IEQHIMSSKDIRIEDNVSVFENHLDNFFEYTMRKDQTSQLILLQEVKQYFDENIVDKTTNVIEYNNYLK